MFNYVVLKVHKMKIFLNYSYVLVKKWFIKCCLGEYILLFQKIKVRLNFLYLNEEKQINLFCFIFHLYMVFKFFFFKHKTTLH